MASFASNGNGVDITYVTRVTWECGACESSGECESQQLAEWEAEDHTCNP